MKEKLHKCVKKIKDDFPIVRDVFQSPKKKGWFQSIYWLFICPNDDVKILRKSGGFRRVTLLHTVNFSGTEEKMYIQVIKKGNRKKRTSSAESVRLIFAIVHRAHGGFSKRGFPSYFPTCILFYIRGGSLKRSNFQSWCYGDFWCLVWWFRRLFLMHFAFVNNFKYFI